MDKEKEKNKFAAMVLYEMYKADWMRRLPLRSILNELTTYYEEYKEDPTESCGIDKHIFENGYSGSIYVCFEEFCGAELRDEEYIRYLTNGNEELMNAARKYVADKNKKEKKMSSQYFAEHGFGVVLTGKAIDDFLKVNSEYVDPYDYAYSDELENLKHVVRYYDDDNDERLFFALDKHSEEYEDMLVIWALEQPDAFKRAYIDLDGLIREMKQEFKFPEDFDWKAHTGYFSCTVYC